MQEEAKREALRRFIAERGLNPNALAKRAGVRSSTLYNFLSGTSKSLSIDVLQKLAEAGGGTIDEVMGNTPGRPRPIRVTHEVGVYGKLFEVDTELVIDRPSWLPSDTDLVAAIATGEALRPIPGDWTVLFEREPGDPEALLGRLCVVRAQGHAQPLLREIRRGSRRGLYDLLSPAAPPIDDAVIQAAHLVVAMTQAPAVSSDG